ncbi:AraC family transcriptional regulator [Chitinophagaceae bacterium LB-8]|uniref:AraC family transcriptional regulator n=1 Tax=Paraflavisolibacter caeni TaxID=2982496 RepID=A0A9X2XTZ7_9BACT|nr:AraC family transcriptional regulator [Paraflavisolibacter caeni]MCU7548820.1 AraC family transcriptional regulator [Paraflavisolibacter caeni]
MNSTSIKNLKRKDGFSGEKQINIPDSVLNRLIGKQVFLHSLFITHIGYFPNAQYHFRERMLGCNDYILLYSLSGKGYIESKNGRFALLSNQFIIIPPNEFHRYQSDLQDPWSIYWVHFSSNQLEQLKQEFNVDQFFTPTDLQYDEQILEIWQQMYDSLASGYSGISIRYANLCLYRFLCFFFFPNKKFKSEKKEDPLERSILYMESNIGKRLQVGEIASYIQYSTSHYTALFKKKTGMTPIDYFIKMKMRYACQMLVQDKLKIKDIALRAGYDDPYFFSKLFKQVTGKSPKEYRQVQYAGYIHAA